MIRKLLVCLAFSLSSPKAAELQHHPIITPGSFHVLPSVDLFKVLEPEMQHSTASEVREHAAREVYSKDPQRTDHACLILIALFVCLSDEQSILDLANYYGSYGNNEMALLWLMPACGAKNPEAMYLVAKMHMEKNHPNPQVSKAIELLEEATRLGHNRARDYLANIYRGGVSEGGKIKFKDTLKAYQLYGISLDESRDQMGIPHDHCAVAMRATMLLDKEIYEKSDPVAAYEILMLTPEDARCRMILRRAEPSPWIEALKAKNYMSIVKGYLKGRDLPVRGDQALNFLNRARDAGQILSDEYDYYQLKIDLSAGGATAEARLLEKICSTPSTNSYYAQCKHLLVRHYLKGGDWVNAETQLNLLAKRKDPWAFAKLAEVHATSELEGVHDLKKAANYMVQALRIDTSMSGYTDKISHHLSPKQKHEFDKLLKEKMSEHPWYSNYFSFKRS